MAFDLLSDSIQDMTDRLQRTRLLFGPTAIEKLQNATVMVVGCGAVGSFAIEALARSGIGHIILADFDTVEESNINRQLFATQNTLGQKKTVAAHERIAAISQDIKVTELDIFFDKNTTLPVHPDFVIDAIDTIASKVALYKWCEQNNIPFISSMGAARKTDPTLAKIAKLSKTFACPLAKQIRKLVRENGIKDFPVVFSTEIPTDQKTPDRNMGSIITVTGTFGLLTANYAIKNIINFNS